MEDRVYEASEVAGRCLVRRTGGSLPLRAEIRKISDAGAILDATAPLARDSIVDVRLELAAGPVLSLRAQVLKSGESGLFLAWAHPGDAAAGQLRRALAEAAGEIPPAVELPSVDQGLVRIDGKTDVYATIRSRARTIATKEIASRHAMVRVLDLSSISRLIEAAVDEAEQRSRHTWTTEERERLRGEAEELFAERLDLLKAERSGLESRIAVLEEQLTNATELLDEEKHRVVAAGEFTVSEAGMLQLEKRLDRLLDRAVRAHEIDGDLESDMRAAVARLLDDERERIAEKVRQAQSDAIELLERKVGRLAKALEETRAERDHAREHARALELAGGVLPVNFMQPGLKEGDPLREEKLHLLLELVEDNRELRNRMKAKEALSGSTDL